MKTSVESLGRLQVIMGRQAPLSPQELKECSAVLMTLLDDCAVLAQRELELQAMQTLLDIRTTALDAANREVERLTKILKGINGWGN